MGMREEKLEWAANVETHSKVMFDATKNPYYVVQAIAAARCAQWKCPEWAVEVLLSGVEEAFWKSEENGKTSIDEALGLTTKRGGTPLKRKADRESIERFVFEDIRTILYCFDASIPDVCEAIYYSIDFSLAERMQDVLPSDPNWADAVSDESLKKIGLTRKQLLDIQAKGKERAEKVILQGRYSSAVRVKLRASRWWDITKGDSLGYSLDQLINRYYRYGKKIPIDFGKVDEETYFFMEGSMLMDSPRCATTISGYRTDGIDYPYESSLKQMKPKAAFRKFPWFKGCEDSSDSK